MSPSLPGDGARSPATLRLTRARLADGRRVDVDLDGGSGTIVAVSPAGVAPTSAASSLDLDGHLLIPAPAEPHAHLDKALTADSVANPAGDLAGAIAAWHAHGDGLSPDDVWERARAAVLGAVAHGVTAIRSHVQVGETGMMALRTLVALREETADLVDLQLVALTEPAQGPDGRAAQIELLEQALELGVDVVGGSPHHDPDPRDCLARLIEAATDHAKPLDLHIDETLDPSVLGLVDLATTVAEQGFAPGATASHCVSLGVQDPGTQAQVAALVADAGIGVVTLPQTNLYLQARGRTESTPRGITALRPLLDAGATVAGGADNLQDPFNPMGRNDPLETAALLVMAGHLSPAEALHAVTTGARAVMGLPPVSITVGSPAELLAVAAGSVREALASAPLDRTVIHRGRVVARTRTEQQLSGRLPPSTPPSSVATPLPNPIPSLVR